MKSSSKRMLGLSPTKQALLRSRLQPEGMLTGGGGIPLRTEATPAPLSFAQQRLWFVEQLAPKQASYNLGAAWRIHGQLDRAALSYSLDAMVVRHEVLRTCFVATDEQPLQVVTPPAPTPLAWIDLCDHPPAERPHLLETHIQELLRQPFDLTVSPLFRSAVLQYDTHDYVMVLVLHHSICDGWSVGIAAQELAALYTAVITGQPAALPRLPIQYADYAVWQRQQLQGSTVERLLDYWQTQLADAPTSLTLPTDFPRPALFTHRGASVPVAISPVQTVALRTLSQTTGATLFMTVLTAWAVLLARLTDQMEVVIGAPIAGRTHRETEPLIGMFVNTLVLRVDLRGTSSFQAALERTREMCLAAYAHQDLPFDYLVEVLQPERDLSRMPLTQTALQLHRETLGQPHFAGVEVRPFGSATVSSKFDLELELSEGANGLGGYLIYNPDLFRADTIQRLADQFQRVVAAVATDPTTPVPRIPLLSEGERHQLLVAWNATTTAMTSPIPPGVGLHDLVLAQAQRTPDACAVRWNGEAWSYQALVTRAAAIAEHLRACGVGAESRVALWVGRSAEMVAGMLGILLAGAAHLPLDPAYPPARVAFMLADAGVRVVLTEPAYAATLPPWSGPVLRLDEIPRQPSAPVGAVRVARDQLAYVIYTSGSTGQPKGVAITHGNAVALVQWAQTVFEPAAVAGVLAATSICFDLSIFELFVPLAMGGSTIVVADALELATLPPATPVTLVNTVPSVLREVLRLTALPPSVRVVNLAGEALPAALVAEVYRQPQVAAVYNLYGPSEDTTYSTWARVERDAAGPPPIGRPIAHTQAYVLDQWGEPVPLGVAGELYLGGAGLARGYVNRPDVTAGRFVPDPFGGQPGSRLYRTGDLVRYRADGVLEYLGRIDQQVKLRGFRIELGEIEAVLNEHPAVVDSVAVVRGETDPRLVAYVIPRDPEAERLLGGPQHLRSWLEARVPAYLVPSTIVPLTEWPLTPNGKLDRQALPAPDHVRPDLDHPFVPPRTADEARIATIWATTLQVDRIGVHDNFFELGGHSLAAVTVAAHMRDTFQIDLPLHYVFEAPTIAQLVQVIELCRQGAAIDTLSASSTLDLWSEVVLDASITGKGMALTWPTDPGTILLTGATGFLGAYLLRDLLQATRATIFCLVRARDTEAANTKLRANLAHYQLWDDRFAPRIVPLIGDLAQPLFGLDPAQFAMLTETIDVIYHNGALVNSVYPYAVLKAPNVGGTHEALRLATQGKLKPLHFVSTTSVFSPQIYDGWIAHETDPLLDCSGLSSGYAQSKWVAEQLVLLARERGIPINIYRSGRIGWDRHTGLWNVHDTLYKLLKACLQVGSAPLLDVSLEAWPVDLVSQAIVHISQQREAVGQAFHLVNPLTITWNDLVHVIHSLGFPLRQLAFNDWLSELQSELVHTTDPTLRALQVLVPGHAVESESGPFLAGVQFDVRQAEVLIAGTAIGWTPWSSDLIRPLLDWLNTA